MWLMFGYLGCGTSTPSVPSTSPKTTNQEEMLPDVDVVAEQEEQEGNIVNLPPVIDKFGFVDPNPSILSTIEVEIDAQDPEGNIVRDSFVWRINGEKLLAEKGQKLRKKDLHKGDSISVTVVVSDGEIETTQTIATKIQNSPPTWARDPRNMKNIDGFTVQATDIDGDPITYRVEGQPVGLSISPQGRISYVGSTTEKGGTYTVSVIAEDDDKANITWQFSMEVSPGSQGK